MLEKIISFQARISLVWLQIDYLYNAVMVMKSSCCLQQPNRAKRRQVRPVGQSSH